MASFDFHNLEVVNVETGDMSIFPLPAPGSSAYLEGTPCWSPDGQRIAGLAEDASIAEEFGISLFHFKVLEVAHHNKIYITNLGDGTTRPLD